jgi:hypothetical protein
MQAAAVFQKSYTVTGRINLPEPDNAEESASISLAVLHGQSEYAGTVSYGKAGSGQAFITITRNGTPEKPCAVQLKPGWHTIRLVVDRGTSKIKMKIWPDDENEPDWQASRTFIARWPSTSIGYRHEGTEPICVDDLYAMETILKNPNENTKRISSLKK